jgi:two-component SAPR family response regulator
MNSPEVKAFIRQHSVLFWYIPEDKKEEISPEILVEFIFNYGDIKAVKELLSIYGVQKVADLFFNSINLSERRKGNYHELTLNYFTLFFKKNAQENPYKESV